MKQRIASLILIASLISFVSHSQNKADDIIGIWLTGGKEPAKIQVYKSGEKFYGKIIWLKNPTENGKQRMDGNNPDKAKQIKQNNHYKVFEGRLINCVVYAELVLL